MGCSLLGGFEVELSVVFFCVKGEQESLKKVFNATTSNVMNSISFENSPFFEPNLVPTSNHLIKISTNQIPEINLPCLRLIFRLQTPSSFIICPVKLS
jgi:hypothetical protein